MPSYLLTIQTEHVKILNIQASCLPLLVQKPVFMFCIFCFLFFVLQGGGGGLSALYSMRDLSSLTRDRTRAPCSGSAES